MNPLELPQLDAAGVTAGCSRISAVTSRPRLGRFRIDVPEIVVPTVELVVCNSAPIDPVTSMVIVVPPTCSVALTVMVVLTSTCCDATL